MQKAFNKLFKKNKVEVIPEYQGWRDGIFTVTSEQVGIPNHKLGQVYGVIMDVGLANEDGTPAEKNLVITETAFASGESSMKTSFGGGLIGLGQSKEVSEIAKQIVQLAQALIDKTKEINNHDLPESGKIYFYFLTTSGMMFHESKFIDIYSQENPFREIFAQFSIIKDHADKFWNEYVKKQQNPNVNASE